MLAEKAVLSRILFSNEWGAVLDRRITEDLFQDQMCRACFRFIAEFTAKYGKVPSLDLVEEDFSELKLAYVKEPVDFYLDKMTENFVRTRGSSLLLNVAKRLVEQPMIGLELLQEGASSLLVDAVPTKDDLIGETVDDRRERYLRLKNVGGMDGMPTPWGVLNEATMGLHAGDFVAIVSRPGVGKTFLLTLFAEFAYRNKMRVLFVTSEMSNTQIMQRFDAVHFRLPYKELRAGLLPDAMEKIYFDGLDKMRKTTHMIVTQDVQGVASIGSKIEQYRPDLVLIDGMYLLAEDKKGSSRWDGVSELSRNLKKLARKKKVPIVATTQFNRMAESVSIDKVTLSNLGFSDSIGQDADVVLGLFRTKDMEMNHEMRVRMLKIREGEAKDFTLQWDLHNMSFNTLQTADDDEILEDDIEETVMHY